MSVFFKQNSKLERWINNNALWALLYMIVSTIANLYLTPYYIRQVGMELYGYIGLVNNVISFIDIISISLNSMAQRYISLSLFRKNTDKAYQYYSSCIKANGILIAIFSVPGIVAVCKISAFMNIAEGLIYEVQMLFGLMVANYFIAVFSNIFYIAAFVKDRLDLHAKVQIASLFFRICIVFFLFQNKGGHVWFISLGILFQNIVLCIFHFFYKKRCFSRLVYHRRNYSFSAIKLFVKDGIWASLNTIGNILNTGLDLWITNLMLTPVLTSVISIASSIGTIFYGITKTLTGSFYPEQMRAYSEGDIDSLVKKLKRSMKFNSAVCVSIFSIFYFCGEEFLRLWMDSDSVGLLFRLSCVTLLSYIITGVVNPLYYVFTITSKLKVPFIVNIIGGLLNVLGMYVLIKHTDLGAYAVVLTTMAINLIHLIDTPIYSAYCLKIGIRTFYSTIIRHIMSGFFNLIILFIIDQFMFIEKGWWRLSAKVMIYLLLSIMICFLILPDSTERKNILQKIQKTTFRRLK